MAIMVMVEKAPHLCKYCGSPSWVEPCDQVPPVDYCHNADHLLCGATKEEIDALHDHPSDKSEAV